MISLHSTGTGWTLDTESMTQLSLEAPRSHLDVPEPDVVASSETHLRNTLLIARSCELDFDIGLHLMLNRSRWSRLVREYVPRDAVERFIDQAQEIDRDRRRASTANFLFHDPKRYEKKHRWGGCLMGMAYNGGNAKDRRILTLYSRTTYIGYMGLMDLCLAHVIAREIGDHQDIEFRWHIANQQWHFFKSLPYVFTQADLMAELEYYARRPRLQCPPAWRRMAKDLLKVEEAYEEHGRDMCAMEKFGPRKRVKRRWMESKGIKLDLIPPSCPVDTLTLEKTQ